MRDEGEGEGDGKRMMGWRSRGETFDSCWGRTTLLCSLCSLWYHASCQGISAAAHRLHSNEECQSAKWFCKKCDKTWNSLKAENESLKKENQDLKQTVSLLLEKLRNFDKEKSDAEVQTEAYRSEAPENEKSDVEVQTEASRPEVREDRPTQTEATAETTTASASESKKDCSCHPKAAATKRVNRKQMKRTKPPIRIIGDSMVKRTHQHVPLQSEGSGCTSLSGAKVSEVKEKVREEARDMRDGLLVVQGGGNDLEYVGKEETVKNMLDAVRSVEGKNVKVAVVGVLRRPREGQGYEWLRKATNRKLHEELMRLKVEWLREKKGDISFLDLDGTLQDNRLYSVDGVHLNNEGNFRLGRRISEWVRAKSLQVVSED